MSTTPTTSGHTSRAKDPAIIRESQKVIGLIGIIFGLIALVLVVWNIVSWVSEKKQEAKKAAARAATNSAPPATVATVEALVLMYEGYTPCSTKIDYRARICWGERRPLQIKFPGIDKPIEFPGEGAFKAPSNVTSEAETEFVSADTNNLHFKVQVYKKIRIQGP